MQLLTLQEPKPGNDPNPEQEAKYKNEYPLWQSEREWIEERIAETQAIIDECNQELNV